MLDALRRGASSWVLKPLLLLLVLAFIVWGVADVFTGSRQGALATVGSSEISLQRFENAFASTLNNLAQRYGRRPTAEEARAQGIDRAVLSSLIDAAALDQNANSLQLGLSQAAVIESIHRDPTFRGADGQFDEIAFNTFLRNVGYGERSYIALRGREDVRVQLSQALFNYVPVPAQLADFVQAWREEKRTVQSFTIDPKLAVKLGEPDDAKLKAFYESNKSKFVAPELRHLAVLMLSAKAAKARLTITDAEIRKAYDDNVEGRVIAEKRTIQQIPFSDKAAAEAAYQKLQSGKSFVDVAKAAGASESDIALGELTKAGMLDQKIAEAAFALAKDVVSQPVEGRFSTVLLRVTNIVPGRTRSFEEMKAEIRDEIADSRANKSIRELFDAVDDGRGEGKPLKQIAAELKLTYVDIPETDQRGWRLDGKPAYAGADAAAILKSGFEGAVGIEAEPVDMADQGYAWVDVLDVTPQRQRPFDEVKADVKTEWERIESAKQIKEVADKLIERAKQGEPMAELARSVGGKLETSKPFRRFGGDGVGRSVAERAFAMQLGDRASALTSDGKSRTVMRLVEIKKPAPLTKDQRDDLLDGLRSQYQTDLAQTYVGELRNRYGVTIDEEMLRRRTGTAQ